jgi:HSP20 family protein
MLGLSPLDRNAVQRRSLNDTNDLYNIFDDFFNFDGFFGKPLKVTQFRLDLKDENDHYLLEAELPGFKKEDITLDYEDGRLLISAKQNEEIEEEKSNYLHRERRSCSMQRAVYLKDVMAEDIDAKLEDGLLKITVPKLQNISNKKMIEIK